MSGTNSVPLQGNPKFAKGQNPTLLPNFDQPVVGANGEVGLQSPAVFLANNPRVAATGSLTVTGSLTAGDTLTVSVALGTFPGASASASYVTVAGDPPTTMAEGIANAINNTSALVAAGFSAGLGGEGEAAEVVVSGPGTVGNLGTLSATVSGTTETITVANSGAFAGGSGPVIATNNFSFGYNGQLQDYQYGKPYLLGFDLITQMVNQGMPII